MRSFTVLTVNAHMGFTLFNRRFILHELREAVRAVSADIVCLQEVLGSHQLHAERHAGRWPDVPQYEFLADTMWSEFAYGQNAAYPHGHHGNALLSKFPILRQENRDVSTAGQEERGVLHCVLDVPGAGEVHAMCTHFGLRERCREQQFDLLCGIIEREIPADAPLVVAGDFNDWRGRGDARLRRCAGVREVFVERTGALAKTFPARLPMLALDRIYVRHLDLVRPQVLSMRPWSHLSDHAALAAELRLPAASLAREAAA